MKAPKEPAVTLCIGGHDPSSGAGILADAEAVRAAGAFAVTIVTACTEQDTRGVRHIYGQSPEAVAAQCRTILEDARPKAIKIGLLGGSRTAKALSTLIDEHPEIPVVIDPVLASGTGQSMIDAALLNQLRTHLIPRSLLLTPNLPEAGILSDTRDPERYGASLLGRGARWVLITGTHADTPEVINRLYGSNGTTREWSWPRLPGEYHGSGCTLASAIAARLALGLGIEEAVETAQRYTWASLKHALRTGLGQLTPNRLLSLHGSGETE